MGTSFLNIWWENMTLSEQNKYLFHKIYIQFFKSIYPLGEYNKEHLLYFHAVQSDPVWIVRLHYNDLSERPECRMSLYELRKSLLIFIITSKYPYSCTIL